MCLPAKPQSLHHLRRFRERHGLAKFGRRHGDIEAGRPSNGANNEYPLESQSTVHLPKDDIHLAEVDDDSMELYLQVKNTVNYFSTDQTQKGTCISHKL